MGVKLRSSNAALSLSQLEIGQVGVVVWSSQDVVPCGTPVVGGKQEAIFPDLGLFNDKTSTAQRWRPLRDDEELVFHGGA